MDKEMMDVMEMRKDKEGDSRRKRSLATVTEGCSTVLVCMILLSLGYLVGGYDKRIVIYTAVQVFVMNVIMATRPLDRSLSSSALESMLVLVLSSVMITTPFVYCVGGSYGQRSRELFIDMTIISLVHGRVFSRVSGGSLTMERVSVMMLFVVAVWMVTFMSFYAPSMISTVRNEKMREIVDAVKRSPGETIQKFFGGDVFFMSTCDRLIPPTEEEYKKAIMTMVLVCNGVFLRYTMLRSVLISLMGLMIGSTGRYIHRMVEMKLSWREGQKSKRRVFVEQVVIHSTVIFVCCWISVAVFEGGLGWMIGTDVEKLLKESNGTEIVQKN